ncbi:hypothetical protein V6Z11_D12G185000 [Gossypium hirsutum]
MALLICSKDSANYAETCFKMFGDRVKYWTTFNEPDTFTVQGYDVGLEAPGHCSILFHLFCKVGSSTTEPYIVAHNVLLSHATAADIYRKKDKVKWNVGFRYIYDTDMYGMDDLNNPFLPALKDENRIEFHNDYLTNVLAAIMEDGRNVKGYFVWSLLDKWEYRKNSVKWSKAFLASS